MRTALFLVFGLFGLVLSDCMPMRGAAGTGGDQAEPTDQELSQNYGPEVAAQVSDIRQKHQAALAQPTSLLAVDAYAIALIAGLKANLSQINRIDWTHYAKDASDMLAKATQTATGEPAANALSRRATLQATLGDQAGAMTTMKAAFGMAHTYDTGVGMVAVHKLEKNPSEAFAMCEKTRPLAKDETQLYQLIDGCLQAVETKETAEASLPWVTADEWTMFRARQKKEQDERLARRQAEEQRDAERQQQMEQQQQQQASQDQGGSAAPGSPASSGPQRVSFTLRSSCSKTVSVFFGQTPKYGSGTTTPIGGNSVQNENLEEGSMLWIVDDSGNGLSSTSVGSGTREVVISPSCTSFGG